MNPVGDHPPLVEGLRDQRVVVFDREELGLLRIALNRYWEDLDARSFFTREAETERIVSLQHRIESIQEKIR